MRVLVVDDDVVVAMLLAIESPVLELVEANRVVSAINLARRPPVDAAVVDRRLPDGDGLEVVRAIRRYPTTCQVPIVVVTAHDVDDREIVLKAGADEYLRKPFEPEELVRVLQRVAALDAGLRKPRRTRHLISLRRGLGSPGASDLPEVPVAVAAAPSRRRRFLPGR